MSEVAKIAEEIQKLNPGAIIELFELDTTNYAGGDVLRFYGGGSNELNSPVTWGGNEYVPFPIMADGFEWRGSGTLPRPKVRIANVTGLLGAAVREMDDLVGSRVTRIRTFVKYLDAVNFPGGVNALADPSAEFARDIFFVNRKMTETKHLIEFELAPLLDVEGVKLPRRVINANACPWEYRGPECSYSGGPVADILDQATADAGLDVCGKRLSSCKLRFPKATLTSGGPGLPFGGFPGVALVRR